MKVAGHQPVKKNHKMHAVHAILHAMHASCHAFFRNQFLLSIFDSEASHDFAESDARVGLAP